VLTEAAICGKTDDSPRQSKKTSSWAAHPAGRGCRLKRLQSGWTRRARLRAAHVRARHSGGAFVASATSKAKQRALASESETKNGCSRQTSGGRFYCPFSGMGETLPLAKPLGGFGTFGSHELYRKGSQQFTNANYHFVFAPNTASRCCVRRGNAAEK